MKIYDVKQQTEEWYRLRYGKVGGSSLKDVMANIDKAIRDNAIYNKLLSEHLEPFVFEEMPTTKDMAHGNLYENEARSQFSRITGKEVLEYGWIEKNDLQGISPDGVIGDFEEGLEIKCPNAATYAKYMQEVSNLIQDYVWQIVNYFSVLPIEKLNVVAYRPMNEYKPIIMTEVFRDTIVKYSSKESDTINNLIIKSDARINELRESLKADILKHSF